MNILALDVARKCGYAHSAGHHGVWILYEPGDAELEGCKHQRLRDYIHDAAKAWGVDLIAFEESSFGSVNPDVQRQHNEFRGVIVQTAADLGIETLSYHPTSIKWFATGSGRSKKPAVIRAARERLGIVTTDDNIADALWILEMAKQNYEPPPSEKKVKRARRKWEQKQPTLFK